MFEIPIKEPILITIDKKTVKPKKNDKNYEISRIFGILRQISKTKILKSIRKYISVERQFYQLSNSLYFIKQLYILLKLLHYSVKYNFFQILLLLILILWKPHKTSQSSYIRQKNEENSKKDKILMKFGISRQI